MSDAQPRLRPHDPDLLLGLLGSVEIPVALFLEQRCSPEDFSSMYSTTSLSEHVSLQWKRRTFHLEHSSKNSQLSLEYLIQFDE